MFERLSTNNSSLARWIRRTRSRHVSEQSPIIIGGCQRSGTTLLRVMLDSHPHIACGPESGLLAGSFLPQKLTKRFNVPTDEIWRLWGMAKDHADFVDRFLTRYAFDRGRQRWAEKTPHHARFLEYIFRHFPKAKFIHMIRDGRDVVCSIRTHPKYRIVDGKKVATGIRKPIEPCIDSWLRETANGLRWRDHPSYFEVRYEDLVNAPELQLRQLCDFIGEPWDFAMLEYHRETGPSRDTANFIANEAATKP